jgi:hypothetical protein
MSHEEGGIKIKILDEGILYYNQNPGYQSIHAYFPYIEQLDDKEFICLYGRGSAMAGADRVVAQLRSTDGGKTWKEEGVVRDPSKDEKEFMYYHGAVTKLKNGRLIAVLTRFDRSDPGELMWDPETGFGYPQSEIVILWSDNKGQDWSEPKIVPFPEGMLGNHGGPVIELDNGNLMLGWEQWKHSTDPLPFPEQKSLVFISEDGGNNWGYPVIVADGTKKKIGYFDARFTRMGSGQLLALFWTFDIKADKAMAVHRSVSRDSGETWSDPEPTNITNGAIAHPVRLDNGKLLAAYTVRYGGDPGIYAVLSGDEGISWDINDRVRLWDATGNTNVGPMKDRELETMMGYAFGMPYVMQLKDGNVMACFWCTSECITHIRWCVLEV